MFYLKKKTDLGRCANENDEHPSEENAESENENVLTLFVHHIQRRWRRRRHRHSAVIASINETFYLLLIVVPPHAKLHTNETRNEKMQTSKATVSTRSRAKSFPPGTTWGWRRSSMRGPKNKIHLAWNWYESGQIYGLRDVAMWFVYDLKNRY